MRFQRNRRNVIFATKQSFKTFVGIISVGFILSLTAFQLLHRPLDLDPFRVDGTARSDDSPTTRVTASEDILNMAARAFLPYEKVDEPYGWCLPDDTKKKKNSIVNGLLLVKVHKAGSTTASSLNEHISRRVGWRKFGNTTITDASDSRCKARSDHYFAEGNKGHQRRTSPSWMWTTVRIPTKRAISSFYFYHLGHRHAPNYTYTDEQLLTMLEGAKNYQLNFMRVKNEQTKAKGGRFHLETVDDKTKKKRLISNDPRLLVTHYITPQVMNAYDFIAVTERFEESVVVFKLLTHLEFGDLMVLTSKGSGGYSRDWTEENWKEYGPCFYIPTQVDKALSPAVQEYLKTNFTQGNGDFLLYDIVNRSLDMTIDSIGLEYFQTQLGEYRHMRDFVQAACQKHAIFPCTSTGVYQPEYKTNCYWKDQGCGYQCVDHAVKQYNDAKL